MKLKDFIKKRKEEMEWKRINGYYDGDPEKNGEYRTLKLFSNYIQLFVDIGANEGNFAKKILEYNNSIQIIAFEPNKTLIPIIQNTVKSNGICYQVAISDNEGIVKLYIHPQDDPVCSMFERTKIMLTSTNSVKGIKVPTLFLNRARNQNILACGQSEDHSLKRLYY